MNQRIARYGEVRTLRIDSRNRQVQFVCQLVGEPDPVEVRIENYEVMENGGQKVLRVGACTSSRPWLQNLLNDFAKGREIPLPAWAASAL